MLPHGRWRVVGAECGAGWGAEPERPGCRAVHPMLDAVKNKINSPVFHGIAGFGGILGVPRRCGLVGLRAQELRAASACSPWMQAGEPRGCGLASP
jgi:hypothetical protein